jgi:hypothetical protein
MRQTVKDKKYLTTGEVAKFLLRSKEWVREQIRIGKILAIPSPYADKREHNRISIEEVERVAIEMYSNPKALQELDYKILAKLMGISYKTVKKGYGPSPEDKDS